MGPWTVTRSACCVGSLLSDGRCGPCSCRCRFCVCGAQQLAHWGLCWWLRGAFYGFCLLPDLPPPAILQEAWMYALRNHIVHLFRRRRLGNPKIPPTQTCTGDAASGYTRTDVPLKQPEARTAHGTGHALLCTSTCRRGCSMLNNGRRSVEPPSLRQNWAACVGEGVP